MPCCFVGNIFLTFFLARMLPHAASTNLTLMRIVYHFQKDNSNNNIIIITTINTFP